MAVLARVRGRRAELRRSEQAVADAVLADPEAAVRSSIAALARQAGVSEPTVLRFCRALGWQGFQDFKLALAQDLAGRLRYAQQSVGTEDSSAELATKVIDGAIASLVRLSRQLDGRALERAVAVLAAARRIECYGLGGASVVATDAQLKFSRLGVPAVAYADPYIHNITASLLGPQDVVLAISNSGRSRDLLKSVDLARAGGAEVVAICAWGSPLARAASIALEIGSDDGDGDEDAYAPIKARIVPMVAIDILAIGVALARGPAMLDRLAQIPRILQDKFVV